MLRQEDLLRMFKKKKEEIRVLKAFWQLSMMKKYNNAIEQVDKEGGLSVD